MALLWKTQKMIDDKSIQKVVENDTLFGIFSHYVKEPLTQEEY